MVLWSPFLLVIRIKTWRNTLFHNSLVSSKWVTRKEARVKMQTKAFYEVEFLYYLQHILLLKWESAISGIGKNQSLVLRQYFIAANVFFYLCFSPSCHILLSHWVIDHQEVNQCRPLHHKLFSAMTKGQSLGESTKFSYLHWTVSPLMWVPCGLNLHNAVI